MVRIYLWLKLKSNWATRSCTWQTSGEEVKTSVTQNEKSKGICMERYPEKYHFLLFLRIDN